MYFRLTGVLITNPRELEVMDIDLVRDSFNYLNEIEFQKQGMKGK